MKRMTGHNRRRMKHLLRSFSMPTMHTLPWYKRKAILRWGERTTFDRTFYRWTGMEVPVEVMRLEFKVFRRTVEWCGWGIINEEVLPNV